MSGLLALDFVIRAVLGYLGADMAMVAAAIVSGRTEPAVSPVHAVPRAVGAAPLLAAAYLGPAAVLEWMLVWVS